MIENDGPDTNQGEPNEEHGGTSVEASSIEPGNDEEQDGDADPYDSEGGADQAEHLPDDTDTDCGNFESQNVCQSKGCSWTAVFAGEEKEDGSGEITGYVCEDEEEIKKEQEHSGTNIETGLIETLEDKSAISDDRRWCRRRRVHRRRFECPYARRRRSPPGPPSAGQVPWPGGGAMKLPGLSGKVATQSSVAHGGAASRAIDGNANTMWNGASCTHTDAGNTNGWWQVDLGSARSISGIKITNRGDCCGDRLSGFGLSLDGKSCATSVAIGIGESKIVACAGVGQVIRVHGPKPVFTICEVAVYVPEPPKADLSTAVATQSSGWAKAPRAIDGNANNRWSSGSCTHTNTQSNPWWQVDLGSAQSISAVKVTNRGDCCGSRLNGFTLSVDGQSCATNVAISQGATKVVPCSGSGQVIKIQVPRRTPLTICEVAVFLQPASTTAAPSTAAPTTAAPATVAPTTAAPTPAPTPPAPPTTAAPGTPNNNAIFDRVDADNNNAISRAEFNNAIDKEFSEGTTAPTTDAPATPTPTTDAPATTGSIAQSQKDAIVKRHNDLRAAMGASDMMKMVWDDTLATAAHQFVAGLSLLSQHSNVSGRCPSGHSQNRNNVGENIAWKWSSSFQASTIGNTDFSPSVQAWYDEISDSGSYRTGGTFQGFGPCPGVCGHYTQVVWAAANKIGCGVAYCPHSSGMGGYELVCQYGTSVPGSNGGNMQGATLFTKGAACASCPAGFQTCSENLCSS